MTSSDLHTSTSAASSASTPPPRRAVRWTRQRRREAWIGLAFVAPMLLLFLAFRFGPTIAAMLLSLTDYRLNGSWTFIGVENYARLFSDPLFTASLKVTVVYVLFFVPFTVICSLATALMLERVVWLRGLFRGAFFLPYVTSIVLAGVLWRWIYSVEDGVLNGLFAVVGIDPVDFLGDPDLVLGSIAAASAWKGFGYAMLILLAGLQAIPREYVEAAMVDGAGSWRRFLNITLPQLRPVLFFVLVIEAISGFQVFDAVYVMTGGGPAQASYSIVYMLYDSGFKYFDFGYASAIGVVLFVIVLVFSLIQRRLLGRDSS